MLIFQPVIFLILRPSTQNGILVSFTPRSQSDTGNFKSWIELKDVGAYFRIWHDCLEAYAELENLDDFYKDPFLKNLEDEFLAGFDLQDEAKNEPLSLQQINYLEEYLTEIEGKIPNYQNEENADHILEIIDDTQYVKSQLGKQSKEWVAKKISSVLAKITKEGPSILKSIFKELGKQVMTQGVKLLFEHPEKFLS